MARFQNMNLIINQTSTFKKALKKFSSKQKVGIDRAVKTIAENPDIGERKKGDLSFLQVYKFKINKQLILLGYTFEKDQLILTLLKLDSHQNFYRDLKR